MGNDPSSIAFTKNRIIAHSSETRIRAKMRGTYCRNIFLQSHTHLLHVGNRVDESLNAAHHSEIRSARYHGHTHVLVKQAAVRGLLPPLKDPSAVQDALLDE